MSDDEYRGMEEDEYHVNRLLDSEVAAEIAERLAPEVVGLHTLEGVSNAAVDNLVTRASFGASFPQSELLESRISTEPTTDTIETLIRELSNKPTLDAARKQIIGDGIFFAAHLLYEGWWNRPNPGDLKLVSGDWAGSEENVGNIRHWLNHGFEVWAPSWSLWNPEETERGECLFGQIGTGDEANSLHVVVAPNAARRLLDQMKNEKRLAVRVRAKGTLYHKSHKIAGIHEKIRRVLAISFPTEKHYEPLENSISSYYMVISDFQEDGRKSNDWITINNVQSELYSAYMWHCLIRKSDEYLAHQGIVSLNNMIFVWEHTNLMDSDCIKFNYESLLFKRRYLEQKKFAGEQLLLFQHSYSLGEVADAGSENILFTANDLTSVLRGTRKILNAAREAADNI